MTKWEGKVVLITGASCGIGRTTAIRFAECGATLFLVALEDDMLQEVKQRCIEKGLPTEKVEICAGDLTLSSFREKAVNTLMDKFGQLDVLADIAGTVMASDVSSTTEQEYDKMIDLNQKAKFLLARLCIPYLKQTKGNIIYMSSVLSFIPNPILVTYCMAKASIDMLTKCLAKELAPYGVRTNAINPGVIEGTEIRRRGHKIKEEDAKKMLDDGIQSNHLKRAGKMEEVASLVLFLASDEAAFITGTTNAIDGGQHLYP